MTFDANAEGAKPYSEFSTVEECASMCQATTDCVAFDFDRNDNPYNNTHCWIHYNVNIEMKRQKAVDHFEKRDCNIIIGKIHYDLINALIFYILLKMYTYLSLLLNWK